MIQSQSEKIVNVVDTNEQMPIVCQCIVKSGGNDDLKGKHGLAHFIEHFLIHSSNVSNFFSDIKIHGVTNFCYTCYYWYVCEMEEAIMSFHEFKDVICKIKDECLDNKIFEDTKEEIIREIIFFEKKNQRLDNLLNVLKSGKFHLPIVEVDQVNAIEIRDVLFFLDNIYTDSNLCCYVYNRNNDIFKISGKEYMRFCTDEFGFNNKYINNSDTNFKIHFEVHGEPNVNFKIILKNEFKNTLIEIILGEIFMVQICEWITRNFNGKVSYEPFFLGTDQIYYIITIMKCDLANKLKRNSYIFFEMLEEILNRERFYEIQKVFLKIIENNEIPAEEELRQNLNYYSSLSYNSYNLVKNKKKLINFLKEISYEEYMKFIEQKNLYLKYESVKILF